MALRLIFPALACFAAFAAFAACGDDDDAAPTDVSEGGLIDSFLVESTVDSSTATSTENARLTLVNAAHDLGPQASSNGTATVRLCFGVGSSPDSLEVSSLAPTPDLLMAASATGFAGIDQGRGVTLPDIALPLAERVLTPIIIASRAVESSGSATCDRLVGPTREMAFDLLENIDYWVLPPISPFTFQPHHAYVLALTGCSGNATTPNPGKCGPGFVFGPGGAGNLALRVFEPHSEPGSQFLHLSTAANAYFFQSGERANIRPSVGSFENGVAPMTGMDPPLFGLSSVVTAPPYDESGYVAFGSAQFSVGGTLTSFFSDIALASGQGSFPFPFAMGGSYVFIAVGDPDTVETPTNVQVPLDGGGAFGASNSRYFHFLGFPSLP